jgi:hypothetical protein
MAKTVTYTNIEMKESSHSETPPPGAMTIFANNNHIFSKNEEGVSTQLDIVPYTLPTASENTLGGIKVGDRLTISDGMLSADDQLYTLPIASKSTLGGIKPDGTTITVDSSTGVASAIGGSDTGGWLPSTEYTTITPGSSGETYTAPYNGWVNIFGSSISTNGHIIVENNYDADTDTTLGYTVSSISYSSSRKVSVMFPVSQVDVFKVTFGGVSLSGFRIFQLKGEV